MDLLNLQPHKVSRDLSGYITYIYGAPKTGKTTLAAQMPNALILAFERGYNALPGVYAQDITSWSKFREALRELKKPEVMKFYKCIVIDTIDVAADMCSKYICAKFSIDTLGDVGFGKGWTAFKDEFNTAFRGLTQLGYAVYFIGHHKEEKVKVGDTDTVSIRPALPNSVRGIIEGLADIYGYAHQPDDGEKQSSVLTLRSGNDLVACGGRFKYIAPEIYPMSYDNLIKAMQSAIDKEAEENGGKYVSDERETYDISEHLEFDDIQKEFIDLVNGMENKLDKETYENHFSPRMTEIIEKILGRGKLMTELDRSQVEIANEVLVAAKELCSKY